MENNIGLKKLLLPVGETSTQFLKGFYKSFPYLNNNRNIIDKPEWYLMGAQFYNNANTNMKENDIHNEFTDFIIDTARHQKNNIHNKLNKDIYNNVYLNWNNLNTDVRKFYETFMDIYKKEGNNFVRVEDYNKLPSEPRNNYKMMMNMNGGNVIFAKELPRLPNDTKNIWISSIDGDLTKLPKKNSSDLILFYNDAFSKNINNNLKYGFSTKLLGGSFDTGFNINLNKIINDVYNKINIGYNKYDQVGSGIFNDELQFNNLLMNSIKSKDKKNLSNCRRFINNNKLNSCGRVDINLASESLNSLGFYKNNSNIFEPVSNWKIRANDNLKNKNIIRNINKEKNVKLLDHLTNIVNYVNHVNFTGTEPKTVDDKPFSNIGLNSTNEEMAAQSFNELINFDMNSFVNDIINNSANNVTDDLPNQSGGFLWPNNGNLHFQANMPLNHFGPGSISTDPVQFTRDSHRLKHINDNMKKLSKMVFKKNKSLGSLGLAFPKPFAVGPNGKVLPGAIIPPLYGLPGFPMHPFLRMNPFLLMHILNQRDKCKALSKKNIKKLKEKGKGGTLKDQVKENLKECLNDIGWDGNSDFVDSYKNIIKDKTGDELFNLIKGMHVLRNLLEIIKRKKNKNLSKDEERIKVAISRLAQLYEDKKEKYNKLKDTLKKNDDNDKDVLDLILDPLDI